MNAFLDSDAVYTSAGVGHTDGRQALIDETRKALTVFVVQIKPRNLAKSVTLE